LPLLAQVSFEQGLTRELVTGETIRQAIRRLGLNWKRVKHRINSPDPLYQQKKRTRPTDLLGLPAAWMGDWFPGPGLVESLCLASHARPGRDADHPIHLVEQSWKKADPDPKALACYGVLWQEGTAEDPERDQMWLRFVTGRPVSGITTQFLAWCSDRLAALGKSSWLLIWDHASWHISKNVRTWLREHNQQVKQTGKGVRILPLFLPKQSRLYQSH
jgi:hypothetical protein